MALQSLSCPGPSSEHATPKSGVSWLLPHMQAWMAQHTSQCPGYSARTFMFLYHPKSSQLQEWIKKFFQSLFFFFLVQKTTGNNKIICRREVERDMCGFESKCVSLISSLLTDYSMTFSSPLSTSLWYHESHWIDLWSVSVASLFPVSLTQFSTLDVPSTPWWLAPPP